MNADLHCHSSHSDGVLTPAALAERAAAHGVQLWALTDHDNLAGLAEARERASALGMNFIDGVEISVTWNDQTVHIVGLGIDPLDEVLVQGLARVRSGRDERALRMADALERLGVREAYANAMRHAGNPSLVGRAHFARVLVEQGYAGDLQEVFRSYLVQGRPGYIAHEWTTLAQAVAWIRGAGGIAGSHGEAAVRNFARLARDFGFYASRASDFHAPGESPVDLGHSAALPDDVRPVWHAPALQVAHAD
jgi:3',5'-nucleoside bisphosphate phosphatase